MIAFQFFLLVLLLFLLNKAESISRHRHTFFFEEDALDAFTEDTIQILGKHAVRVNNFTGIREWRVKTTPEEIIKSVTQSTAWSENWTLRVQIASETQTLFHPLNIVPVPGIHIGISLGNQTFSERLGYKNMDFLTICKYLDALLGVVMCDKEKSSKRTYHIDLLNSISLPDGNIYYYSSIPSYDVPSSSSILGRRSSKEYRRPAIIDLHFNFDKKTNKTKAELRMIWKYQNQNIEINKDNQDDRVELGVFGPQLDSESILGEKIVFGEDDQPEPTMVTEYPRTLSSDSFFNSSIYPSQSFHPYFSTSIKYSVIEDKCKDYILYVLPNSFFVDVYQLKDKFSDEQIKVWGETDLEIPFGVASLKWGSLILIAKQSSEDLCEFSLPLHMRYQPAISGNTQSHVFARAPWPFVIRVCENIKNEPREPLFAPTPLPLSLLFPSTTEIKYLLPKQEFLRSTSWPREVVKVPIGQLSHLKFVEWWTIIVALAGCAWVIWIALKKVSQWRYKGDNDKID
ncbi:hypothetical protein RhiirA4_441430 [Rhizophagus irregularis]|uniref:Protein PBN1 n=1 Tax=Rhizophagus irregularis TaxID=588596 RepID=A0A2I1G4S7_9GLOM|nr:hypothetical protein RhiirA4_441430 [Rhizophagus irregularis]